MPAVRGRWEQLRFAATTFATRTLLTLNGYLTIIITGPPHHGDTTRGRLFTEPTTALAWFLPPILLTMPRSYLSIESKYGNLEAFPVPRCQKRNRKNSEGRENVWYSLLTVGILLIVAVPYY